MSAKSAASQPTETFAELDLRYRVNDPVRFTDSAGKVLQGTIIARCVVQEDGGGWAERYLVRAAITEYGSVKYSDFPARIGMLMDVEGRTYEVDEARIKLRHGAATRGSEEPDAVLASITGL